MCIGRACLCSTRLGKFIYRYRFYANFKALCYLVGHQVRKILSDILAVNNFIHDCRKKLLFSCLLATTLKSKQIELCKI